MGLRDEIKSKYVDGCGLVAPNEPESYFGAESGNGVCYTGEFYALLHARREHGPIDGFAFENAVRPCFKVPGLLARSPAGSAYSLDPEGPDDYYGLAAGCAATSSVGPARDVLAYGWQHLGMFDNTAVSVSKVAWTSPSTFLRYLKVWLRTPWRAFLWRQPQLVAALYAAGYGKYRPRWTLPLFWYAALCIAVACRRNPGADNWRLTWLLVQTVSPVSWTCRQAAKLWRARLAKAGGMRTVTQDYFSPGHPLNKYYVD